MYILSVATMSDICVLNICDVTTSTISLTAIRSSAVVLSQVDIRCTLSENVDFGQYFTESRLFSRHVNRAVDELRSTGTLKRPSPYHCGGNVSRRRCYVAFHSYRCAPFLFKKK